MAKAENERVGQSAGSSGGAMHWAAPGAVLQMLGGLRAIGLDVDAICAAAGLDPSTLTDRATHLQLAEVAPLWRLATERFGRATIGLHVGAALPPGHIIDYIALASPTLRAALTQIVRYYGLIRRPARWDLRPLPGGTQTLFEYIAEPGAGTMDAQLRELSIAIAAGKVQRWSGRPAVEVWFPHAALGPADEYRGVLGCPARFERELSGVVVEDALLDAPRTGSDPQLAGLLQAHAEVLLARVPADATFSQQVHGAVVAELREGEPEIGKVARRMATSERSLQRRLQEEGTSFRGVVDAVRHELADVYLAEKNLSIADITYLLGYSEPAAFIRAYKRWTGQTPSSAGQRRSAS